MPFGTQSWWRRAYASSSCTASTWDSHDYIARAHGSLIRSVDRPIAGLLKDLKQRGLLEETLVVWMGEFGSHTGQRDPGWHQVWS